MRHGRLIRVDVMQVVLVNAALLVERDPRIIHQHVVDVIQQKWLVLKALNGLERLDLWDRRLLAFLFLYKLH